MGATALVSRGRTAALALTGALAWLSIRATLATARAGSGSSHFGGSSGSSGSGGSSSHTFGGGGSTSGTGAGAALIVLVIAIVVAIAVVCGLLQARRRTRRRAERAQQVAIAAVEAAEDDAAFEPDAVRAGAERLFREIQASWSENRIERLGALVGDDLMIEWRRRLEDFRRRRQRNRIEVQGAVSVDYVGLVNRAGDRDDRVVVRIAATLSDVVVEDDGDVLTHRGTSAQTTRFAEYWTLGKRDGDWILLSIEQDAEGEHQLDAEIVASPWADTGRLRDESVVETAVADKLPEGFSVADVADLDFEGDARAAALDLSVADPRFGPDVLEVAARRAVAAWVEAIDGEDDGLRAIAAPEVVRELLHPGDPGARTRLVVRGLRVRRLTIAALDAGTDPPTMSLEVRLHGRRYVEDRDTAAIVSGSQSRALDFAEHWTMALSGPDAQPWLLSGTGRLAPRG